MRARIDTGVMGGAHQKVHVCHESCAKFLFRRIRTVSATHLTLTVSAPFPYNPLTQGLTLRILLRDNRGADMTFQELILSLQRFWADRGCVLQQPYDIEVGAGTFNPATFFRVLGPDPWRVAYVEPSRRPTDGRYGENPNRLQHYYQFQVVLKPAPEDVQGLYLQSLASLGLKAEEHDIFIFLNRLKNHVIIQKTI